MTSANPSNLQIARALAGVEAWFDSVRRDDGYTGPSIGRKQCAVAFCGSGFDWRYEGLIDGYAARYAATQSGEHLDRLEAMLLQIAGAQLIQGCFRNSAFDANPCESGMPHEAAMVAAGCRAQHQLQAAGRARVAVFDAALERYCEEYLLKRLWSKQLLTFKDWEITDFTSFTPDSVAAAIEVLLAYGPATGQEQRLERYIAQAGESLLKVQCRGGALDGAMPPSSGISGAANPYRAARCLPALTQLAAHADDDAYRQAADRLASFVEAAVGPEGQPYSMMHADQPHSQYPILTGAVAGTVIAMERAGYAPEKLRQAAVEFLLPRQAATGAFDNAMGFGRAPWGLRHADWRDVMPVPGWQDKIFAFLAAQCDAPVPAAACEFCERPVTVLGRRALYREDANTIRVVTKAGKSLFDWKKRTPWPTTCLL